MAAAAKKGIVRRRVRPRILVALKTQKNSVNTLIDQSRDWEWNLLDYALVRGAVPQDPPLSGAIVDLLPDDPLVRFLQDCNCPVVRLGTSFHPLDHMMPAVLPDLAAAGKLAARHFLERGFQHATYVGWQPECEQNAFHHLFRAYREALEEAGVETFVFSKRDYCREGKTGTELFRHIELELGNWLEMLPKPIGIFSHNDFLLAQLCMIYQNRGGHVPEEVALLGYGNRTWCERSPVSLSSIAPAHQERARRAMHLLRSLIEGNPAPEKPIMVPPAGLIKRRSSDILAMSDILVAQALIFIWEHIQDNISVADVARSVGLSDRQLGRRFQQAIGRSVNQEIVRRRIEMVKELLQSNSGSVADIAKVTGYRSARYLHFAFQKAVGMTPGEYRKKHAS